MRARANSSTSIVVSWSEPVISNGIIAYVVTVYPTGVGMSGRVKELVTGRTRTQLTELEGFTSYTIFIQAFTGTVLSMPSNSVMETTHKNGISL